MRAFILLLVLPASQSFSFSFSRAAPRHLRARRCQSCRARCRTEAAQVTWPPQREVTLWDDLSCIALVTGTGVGGGFLAVPYTTAAAGAVPSSVVMLVLWCFIFAEAVVVIDVIIECSQKMARPVSFATVAKQTLGPATAVVASGLFLFLMLLTHLSQFSKAGQLLATVSSVPYGLGVALVSISLSSFALLGPVRLVSRANSLLTAGFMLAVAGLFVVGSPLADWSRLLRADWSCCWGQVPTILQILIYMEVLPTVCALLNFDRKRARRAVLIGAAFLLCLNVGWSALGIGLVPFAGKAARMADPVDVILRSGGAVALVVNVLAACAIGTTIVGTNLSLHSFFLDACRGKKRYNPGLLCTLAVAGPLLLAICSPGIFFRAIGLQGAYPLTMLWGCLPPAIALVMDVARKSRKPLMKRALLLFLLASSIGSLLTRFSTDLGSLR